MFGKVFCNNVLGHLAPPNSATKNTINTAMAQPRLLDQLRDRIRLKHYSIRTEQAYLDWVRRFILFHGKRHPAGMGKDEVEAFLSHLAVKGRVAASTQNQAKSAILFLYREVLGHELAWLENVEQAKAPRRLPVVLTQAEVAAVLTRMPNYHRLMAQLLYGCHPQDAGNDGIQRCWYVGA